MLRSRTGENWQSCHRSCEGHPDQTDSYNATELTGAEERTPEVGILGVSLSLLQPRGFVWLSFKPSWHVLSLSNCELAAPSRPVVTCCLATPPEWWWWWWPPWWSHPPWLPRCLSSSVSYLPASFIQSAVESQNLVGLIGLALICPF